MPHAMLFVPLLLAAAPTSAGVDLPDCDETGWGLTELLISPSGDGIRSFADGDVLVLSVGKEEPACCGAGVAFIYPSDGKEEPVYRKCAILEGFYSDLDVDAMKASYDKDRGLVFSIPARAYDTETAEFKKAPPVTVILNRAAQTVRRVP